MTFEQFMAATMLPAECDDPEVLRGMRMTWDSGYSEGYAKAVNDFLKSQNRSVFHDMEKQL